MGLLLWFLLLAITVEGEGVYCPHYCQCGMSRGLRHVKCVGKGLISVELDVPKMVEWLQLSNNSIYELRDHIFEELGLDDVMELNLDNNAIRSVGFNAFSGLEKLQYVDLSRNHLYYLPIAVFGNNPNMMYLNLQGNPFRNIRSAFLVSKTISILDVSNARLNYVSKASFVGLPALTKLNISNNHIDSLSISNFENLTILHELDISNNKFSCDPSMELLDSWLESKHILTIGSPCYLVTNPPGPMFEKMMVFGGMPEDKENEFDDYTFINSRECNCNKSENEEYSTVDYSERNEERKDGDNALCNPLFHILAFGNGLFCGIAVTTGFWLLSRIIKVKAQRRQYNTMQDDLPPAYSDLFNVITYDNS